MKRDHQKDFFLRWSRAAIWGFEVEDAFIQGRKILVYIGTENAARHAEYWQINMHDSFVEKFKVALVY